jgi:hypothetical protein
MRRQKRPLTRGVWYGESGTMPRGSVLVNLDEDWPGSAGGVKMGNSPAANRKQPHRQRLRRETCH